MMEELIDEFIINSVREIEFIYNKRNKNYKDSNKKREAFQKIAVNIQQLYSLDITGENVQKRWESLKDRFVREHKKLKDMKSGSGADEKLLWIFYSLLLFLEPFISHRQTKSSYFQKAELKQNSNMVSLREFQYLVNELNELISKICIQINFGARERGWPENFQREDKLKRFFESSSLEALSSPENTSTQISHQDITYEKISIDKMNDSCASSTSRDHNYCSANQENNTEAQTLNPPGDPQISSESTSSQASFTTPTLKRIKARVPEWDNFAKKRKQSGNIIEEQFITSSKEISSAVSTISQVIEKRSNKLTDQYLPAIEESLSRVPQENRTSCLIEILKVIAKFQSK